jgi:hypothetical protein
MTQPTGPRPTGPIRPQPTHPKPTHPPNVEDAETIGELYDALGPDGVTHIQYGGQVFEIKRVGS